MTPHPIQTKPAGRLVFLVCLLVLASMATLPTRAGDITDIINNVSDIGEGDQAVAEQAAADQAAGNGDGLGYHSTEVETQTFSGTWTPPERPADKPGLYRLAIFSDDGCKVTLDGTVLIDNLNKGQPLPDLGKSFHVLDPVIIPGEPVNITVEYSNCRYIQDGEEPDIDGCTLFVFLEVVDLAFENVEDSKEESDGGYVPINGDNDNGSALSQGNINKGYIPTTRDFDATNLPKDDDDLRELTLTVPDSLDSTASVILNKNENQRAKIRVWEDRRKEKEIILPKTWDPSTDDIPEVLYVEGKKEGLDERTVELSLELKAGAIVAIDKVKLTVIPVLVAHETAHSPNAIPNFFDNKVGQERQTGIATEQTAGEAPVAMRSDAIVPENSMPGELEQTQIIKFINQPGANITVSGSTSNKIYDFDSPHTGDYRVDGKANSVPFYSNAEVRDRAGIVVSIINLDGPQILTGDYKSSDGPNPLFARILPGNATSDGTTEYDTSMFFILYAMWKFDDNSMYVLGIVSWEVRYQGTISSEWNTDFSKYSISQSSGDQNDIYTNGDFTPFNGDPLTIEPPVANDADFDWR